MTHRMETPAGGGRRGFGKNDLAWKRVNSRRFTGKAHRAKALFQRYTVYDGRVLVGWVERTSPGYRAIDVTGKVLPRRAHS